MAVQIKPEDRQRVIDLLDEMDGKAEQKPWWRRMFLGTPKRGSAGLKLVNLLVPEAKLTEESRARAYTSPVEKIIGRKISPCENPVDGNGETFAPVVDEMVRVLRAQLAKDT